MVLASNMPKYAPAEAAAAEIFNRPFPPEDLKGKAAFFEDCAEYVKKYTELAECPRFAPLLDERFAQLTERFKSCSDGKQALVIATEGRSMCCSLAFRFGPAGLIGTKEWREAPGNIPELLEAMPPDFRKRASEINRMHPDALTEMQQLYEEALEKSRWLRFRNRESDFGPTPDALITAAQKGQSFDSVRWQTILNEASPGGDLHSCY